MSTRSTTKFAYGPPSDRPEAIVYRHTDGYPEGMLPDLGEFFEDVENEATDHRYTDPPYLAAKWLVWLARHFASPRGSLNFLSVGVCQEDPSDIQYTYWLDCADLGEDGRPTVYMARVPFGGEASEWDRVQIPAKSGV